MVDLTDVAGNPTDAIVWLRNGAGKTTMLSLLLALILPARRDFLATRTKKRTLEDLVQSGDTAHVVAEWVDPLGQLLLTGAVYEWDNRIRPRDGQGKEHLRRSWWCLHPDPVVDGSTLDDLPFTLRSRGRYDRERFRAHVSNLATQGVNAVVADQTITEWHAALRERRFDPELFHYFTEVNAAEGGIDGLFAGIDSPGAFVRYLLRFVGDRQRIAPVRELLSDTAAEIAKRPVYLAEREFCVLAGPKVTALGEGHQAVLDANRLRDGVLARTAGYKRALSDAEKTAAARRDQAKQRVDELDAELTTDRATVEAARRRRAEYLRIAAAFRLKSAGEALVTAVHAASDAKLEMESWGAVDDHLRLESEQAKLTQRKTALRTASDEARPLVDQVETAKAILAGALENEIDRARLAVTDKSTELSEATAERSRGRTDRDNARDRLAELERRRARQGHDEQRTAKLIEQRNTDALLQAEITAVIKELPDDGMAGLTARVAKAEVVGAAKAELNAAEHERDEVPQARLRANDVVVEPTDRADAQRLAEQEEQEAVAGQQEIGQKERDRGAAERAAARADTRAGMLRDQAALLRHVDIADEPLGVVPEDDAGTRAAVRRLAEDLDEARGKYETADRARARQVDELRRWAGQDRFASVAEDEHGQAVHRLREMFRGESVIERVAVIADISPLTSTSGRRRSRSSWTRWRPTRTTS